MTEPERCLCGDGPGISMKCPIHWPKAPAPAEPMTFDPGDPEYVNYGSEAPAPAEGAEPTLQTRANDLLRALNRQIFGDSIDITRLPTAVALVEEFAEAYAASLREQLAEHKQNATDLFDECRRRGGEIEELQKENERLREALRKLATGNRAPDVLAIAREALAGKES